MKILLLFSLLVTGSAWAEWIFVAKNASATFYIDPSSIRKEGNLRKVWEVHDFKQPDTGGSMSRRMKNEYDCQGERSRGLALSVHSGPMLGGKTLASFGEGPNGWIEIPPDTPGNTILKMVCAK